MCYLYTHFYRAVWYDNFITVGSLPLSPPSLLPAHRPCHRNDSGIEFQSVTSSGGSSQDTSYVRNLFSSVGSNLYDDAYDHGHGQSRLTNHGLENFENEPAHRHGLDERQVDTLHVHAL